MDRDGTGKTAPSYESFSHVAVIEKQNIKLFSIYPQQNAKATQKF